MLTFLNSENLRCIFCLAVIAAILGLSTPVQAQLKVIATTEDIASLARVVGGEWVEVKGLTKGYQDSHFVQAKPSLMVMMHEADLLVYNGLDLEVGWLPLLIQGSRNSKIRFGKNGSMDLSLAIDPIQVPKQMVDRSMGDVHPFGNPHYTLDPENIKPILYYLADKFSEMDPTHASEFKANRDRYVVRFEKKLEEWKKRLKPYSGQAIVTYHRTWDYFLERFELASVANVEIKPGVQPTPSHLATVMDIIRKKKVKILLQASYYQKRFSLLLTEKTGAKLLILAPGVAGLEETPDTISFFDHLIKQIVEGFNE